MKRKISFRAWHKKEKKLCAIDVLTTNGAFLIGVENGPDELMDGGKIMVISPKNGRFCMNEDIELMQFTGLTDKNGKEIYEGDVVRYDILDGDGDRSCGLSVVKYKEYGFEPFIFNTVVEMDDWYNHELKNFEVISNIFESPELLNS